MEENNYQDEMEAYLSGEMTDKEQSSFEEIISTNPKVAQDVRLLQDIEDALSGHSKEMKLVAQLDEIGHRYFKEEEEMGSTEEVVIEPLLSTKWIILGSIALLIGVALWWINTNSNVPEKIFAAYYEPYSASEATRGEDVEADYIKYYENNEYDKAIPLLKKLVSEFPNQGKYQIILGNSYLNTNPPNIAEAIRVFEALNKTDTVYQITAKWYLALALLKNNEVQKSKKILQEIASQPKGRYPKRAQSLLKEI